MSPPPRMAPEHEVGQKQDDAAPKRGKMGKRTRCKRHYVIDFARVVDDPLFAVNHFADSFNCRKPVSPTEVKIFCKWSTLR